MFHKMNSNSMDICSASYASCLVRPILILAGLRVVGLCVEELRITD